MILFSAALWVRVNSVSGISVTMLWELVLNGCLSAFLYSALFRTYVKDVFISEASIYTQLIICRVVGYLRYFKIRFGKKCVAGRENLPFYPFLHPIHRNTGSVTILRVLK